MRHSRPTVLALSTVPFYLLISAQSFVGGDLSRTAPFSIPAADFLAAVAHAPSNKTVAINGYNTSAPAGASDATGNSNPGWRLSIGVTADVSLRDSNDENVDKGRFVEATTIGLVPPSQDGEGQGDEGVKYSADDWRVCAIVFTQGLGASQLKTASDGETEMDGGCGGLLESKCIQALQVDAVNFGNGTSSGRGGRCESLTVPDECGGAFVGLNGVAYGEFFFSAHDLFLLAPISSFGS